MRLSPTPLSNPSHERAILVGVEWKTRRAARRTSTLTTEESLEELAELTASAGALLVDRQIQARPGPEAATLIGQGKVQELHAAVASLPADLVIFDHDLTPTQQRNLEKAIGCKVIDRQIQARPGPEAATLIGQGKVQELHAAVASLNFT